MLMIMLTHHGHFMVFLIFCVTIAELQLADTLGSPRGSPVPRRRYIRDDGSYEDDEASETDSRLMFRRNINLLHPSLQLSGRNVTVLPRA